MSLSLTDAITHLSPRELEYVTEHALADGGPFTIESVEEIPQRAMKVVVVRYRTQRQIEIEVPSWQLR